MEVLEKSGWNALDFTAPIAYTEVTGGQSIKKPKKIIPGLEDKTLFAIVTRNGEKKGGCCFR